MAENRVKITITAEGKNAEQAFARLNKKMGDTNKSTARTRKSMQELGAGVGALRKRVVNLKTALVGLGGAFAIRAIFETGKDVAALNKSFEAITGSSEAARSEMSFLHKVADDLGQNFYALAGSYKGVAAASKGSVLEGQKTRDIFVAVTKASASLGLSADETSGALRAISQMMSKGNVQAEELRGQLGERLPGAFNLAAEAMGVSTQKLNKMLDKGEVLAADLLPRLAEVLSKKYSGSVAKAVEASNKWEESWIDVKNTLAQSGFLDGAATALKALSEEMQTPEMQASLKDLGAGLGVAVKHAGELVPKLSGVASNLDEIYKTLGALPEEVTSAAGYGVVGMMLFGGKGGFLIGAVASRLGYYKRELQGIAAVFKGEIGALEYAFSSEEELEKMLGGISRHKKTTAPIKMKVDWEATHPDAKKAVEEQIQIEKDKNEKLNAIEEKRREESHKRHMQWLQRRGEIDTAWERKQGEKIAKEELRTEQEALRAKHRLEQAHLEARKNLQADFSRQYARLFGDQYEMERKAIEAQARTYRAAGADKIKVKQWEATEIQKINEDELRAHKEAERKKILASQDFFGGMKLAYDDLEEHQRTWAQTGYDIMEDFAQQSGDVMGGMLFDTVKGDMKSLGDYWESFWDNMLKSMTSYIGQMAAEWATTELISLGSSFASMIFHDGETKLKQDELYATLQEGEMVIPKDQAEAIRTAVGHGGKSSRAFFDDVVNHVKVGAKHDFVPSSWAEPDIAGMATAQLISSGIAGAGAGYANYANVMRQGRMLQDAGFDISASKIKEVALDHALAGAVSTMVTGFAGNFIGELGSYGLGVGDYIIDTPGAGKINIGSFINAGIATLAGAGLPGMMLAGLSPLTNLAMSSIADALDLRGNETLRDSLENKYGHVGGRLAYQSAKSFLESYNPAAKIQNLVDKQGDIWAYDPVLGENIIVLKEQINGNAAKHLRSRIDRQFGLHGKGIADSIWSHGTSEAKASLAGIVTGSKWGFSSYDTREAALKAQGYTSQAAHDLARSPHPPSHSTGSYHSGGGGLFGKNKHGFTTRDIERALSRRRGGGGGRGRSSSRSSRGSHGATRGTPGGSTGRIGRYDGGIIDTVLASNPYDDGLVPMALGEGVISRAGMAWLDDINAGRVPEAMQSSGIDYDALGRAIAKALQSSQSSSMDGDVGRALFTIAKHCQRTARVLNSWDAAGQPEVRSASH